MEQEKKKILEAIANGEITSEEGYNALQALEQDEQDSYSKPSSEKSAEYKQDSLVTMVGRVLDKAVQKIKDIDLDFNFGETIHVNRTHAIDSQIKDIQVKVANGSILFEPSENNKLNVLCDAYVYSEKDEMTAEMKVAKELKVKEDEGTLQVVLKNRKIKSNMTIQLPDYLYEKIEAKTYNGKIENTSCNVADLICKTTNGEISLKGITGEKLIAETINGKVIVDHCQGEECEVETINGKIEVRGRYNNSDFQTTNGKISYVLEEPVSGTIRCKTEASKIKLSLPKGMNIKGEVETMVGGLTCDLENMAILKEKKEVVNKKLNFQAKSETQYNLDVYIETKAGSIDIHHID